MTFDTTGARCLDHGELFQSVDQLAHEQAREYCGAGTATECPALAACAAWAASLEAEAPDHRPHGTWAGMLYGGGTRRGRRNPREHGTQRGYDQHRHQKEPPCRACKTAHYEVLRDTFGVAI